MKRIAKFALPTMLAVLLYTLFAVFAFAEDAQSPETVTVGTAAALESAIESAPTDDTAKTVVLTGDVFLDETIITVTRGQNVTLDLGGYTLTYDKYGKAEPLTVEAGATFKMMNGEVIISGTKATDEKIFYVANAVSGTYTDENKETATISYAEKAKPTFTQFLIDTKKIGLHKIDVSDLTENPIMDIEAPPIAVSAGNITFENVYCERKAGGTVSKGQMLEITGGKCTIDGLSLILDKTDSVGASVSQPVRITRSAAENIEFTANNLVIKDAVKPTSTYKDTDFSAIELGGYGSVIHPDSDTFDAFTIQGSGKGVKTNITNSLIQGARRGLYITSSDSADEEFNIVGSFLGTASNWSNSYNYILDCADGGITFTATGSYLYSPNKGVVFSTTTGSITWTNCSIDCSSFQKIGNNTTVIIDGGMHSFRIDNNSVQSQIIVKNNPTIAKMTASAFNETYLLEGSPSSFKDATYVAPQAALTKTTLASDGTPVVTTTMYYESAAGAFTNAQDGDEITLFAAVSGVVVKDKVTVYTNGYNFEHSTETVTLRTQTRTGRFIFTIPTNYATVNFYDNVYGIDSSIKETSQILTGTPITYTGEPFVVYGEIDFTLGGTYGTVGGWEMYVGDESIGELTDAGISDDYIGMTVSLYPIFEDNPYSFAVKTGDTVTPYTTEDFATVIMAIAEASEVRIYQDTEITETIVMNKANITLDMNGFDLYTVAKRQFFTLADVEFYLYSSEEGAEVFGAVGTAANASILCAVNGTTGKAYLGYSDAKTNSPCRISYYTSTVVTVYGGGTEAWCTMMDAYLLAADNTGLFTACEAQNCTLNLDDVTLHITAGKSPFAFGQTTGGNTINVRNSRIYRHAYTSGFTAIATSCGENESIYLENTAVYGISIAGATESNGVTVTVGEGCTFDSYSTDGTVVFTEGVVPARIAKTTDTVNISYSSLWGTDYTSVSTEFTASYASAAEENTKEITWVKVVNGVTVITETELWVADVDTADMDPSCFEIRESIDSVDGLFSFTTSGAWNAEGTVYTYTEQGTVENDFLYEVSANVWLDASIEVILYIPVYYFGEGAYIQTVEIGGETINVDTSKTVSVNYTDCVMITCGFAPKDAYQSIEIGFGIDTDDENGTADFTALYTYSLLNYLEALAAVDPSGNAYIKDAQALIPALSSYVIGVSKFFETYDKQNASFARFETLAGDFKASYEVDDTKVKDTSAVSDILSAAYMDLDTVVGYVFTFEKGIDGTISVRIVDENNEIADVLTVRRGTTDAGIVYYSFSDIEVYNLLYDIEVTVTPVTTMTDEETGETVETVGDPIVFRYNYYTYMVSMIEQGKNDVNESNFAVATYAYATAAKAFDDKGYNVGKIEQSPDNTEIDLSGVTFEDASFVYDGTAHSITASGIPEGVTVTYQGNGQTNAGTYTVTAIFSAADGTVISSMTATLTITPGVLEMPIVPID